MRIERKNRPERRSYNLRITKEEDDIIRKLRDVYCVNIPNLLRRTVRDLYCKMENKNG